MALRSIFQTDLSGCLAMRLVGVLHELQRKRAPALIELHLNAVGREGVAPESLRRWRDKADATVAVETRQSAEDAMVELRSLRAEVARLRKANEILTMASAFFAAKLDPTRP